MRVKFSRKITIIFVLLSCCFFLLSVSLYAASLWDDSDSFYKDNKAHKVGDILTIIIRESTTASQQASTDASQSSQVGTSAGTGILDFIKAFSMSESDNNTATGTTSRSGNLSATMAVQIVEILDNGNFKIAGSKELKVNEEKQNIKLIGVVRPEDIGVDNTVDSTYIANADINYEGKGVIGDKQKSGIITRILNWFF